MSLNVPVTWCGTCHRPVLVWNWRQVGVCSLNTSCRICLHSCDSDAVCVCVCVCVCEREVCVSLTHSVSSPSLRVLSPALTLSPGDRHTSPAAQHGPIHQGGNTGSHTHTLSLPLPLPLPLPLSHACVHTHTQPAQQGIHNTMCTCTPHDMSCTMYMYSTCTKSMYMYVHACIYMYMCTYSILICIKGSNIGYSLYHTQRTCTCTVYCPHTHKR